MNKDEIENELFSLRFENKSMADLLFYNEAERWVHGFTSEMIETEHILRYKLAEKYVENKDVLDIACGSGYGSYLLANAGKAKKVLGVDLDDQAIRYGNHRYAHPNIKRVIDDALTFSNPDQFDVVVSFETIEHLPKYDIFLKNIKKLLAIDGILLISTPIVNHTNEKPLNPYHHIEWSYNDFYNLINNYFKIEETYFQNIKLKSDKLKNSFFSRFKRKIIQEKKRNIIPFEKYMNQYRISDILSGYTVLICRNRQH